jgi:hypothetical protein
MLGLTKKRLLTAEEAEEAAEIQQAEENALRRRMALAVSPVVGSGPIPVLASCAKAALAKVENENPLPLEAFKASRRESKPPRKVPSADEKARATAKRKATIAKKKADAARKAANAWVETKPGVIQKIKKAS